MAGSSPIIGERHVSSGPASPVAVSKVASTDPWPTQTDEDIDRLVALHKVILSECRSLIRSELSFKNLIFKFVRCVMIKCCFVVSRIEAV